MSWVVNTLAEGLTGWVYILATCLACYFAWRRRWVLSALPLIVVSAVRYGIGTDFDLTYLPQYLTLQWVREGGGAALADKLFCPFTDLIMWLNRSSSLDVLNNYTTVLDKAEPLWRALYEGCYWSGLGFRAVIAFSATVTLALVFIAIVRQSKLPWLAVYFFVCTSNYFLSLNIVRQYLAISIILAASEFIRNRRWGCWIVAVVVAALWHQTALLLLPCYWLFRLQIRPRWCFGLVAFALGTSPFARPILEWLMSHVGLAYYCRYFDSPWAKDGFEYIFFAINLAFMVAGAYYYKYLSRHHDYFVFWYNLTVVGTLFLAFSGSIPLMKRMNFYFAAPQFLLLPELLAAEQRPQLRRLFTIGAVLLFFAETIVAVGLMNKNECLPYTCTRTQQIHFREARGYFVKPPPTYSTDLPKVQP